MKAPGTLAPALLLLALSAVLADARAPAPLPPRRHRPAARLDLAGEWCVWWGRPGGASCYLVALRPGGACRCELNGHVWEGSWKLLADGRTLSVRERSVTGGGVCVWSVTLDRGTLSGATRGGRVPVRLVRR